MIADLEDMVKAQLMLFKEKTKCVPRRLLYFRDGVSEGQFQQVFENAILFYRVTMSTSTIHTDS